MKLSPSFFRTNLLPKLFQAKQEGLNITSKATLLNNFEEDAEIKHWICSASDQDVADTAEIVNAMVNAKHDVLAELGVKETLPIKPLLKIVSELEKKGKNELASKVKSFIERRYQIEAADLYKKNTDDELDKHIDELNSAISEKEIELGARELSKYL